MASKSALKIEEVVVEPDANPVTSDEMRKLLTKVVPEGTNDVRKKNLPPSAQPTMLFICRDMSMVSPVNRYDLVYPGIIIGDHRLAYDKPALQHEKVTHILNAAQGTKFAQIDTNDAYYADLDLKFFGVSVMDTSRTNLSIHFEEAASFINDAVSSGGKVYVHCFQGISRSSSLVLAYLMLYTKMPLRQAIRAIRKRRAIYPNDGFLKQLVALNNSLFTNAEGTTVAVASEQSAKETDTTLARADDSSETGVEDETEPKPEHDGCLDEETKSDLKQEETETP